MCNLQEETFLSDIQQMTPLFIREEMSEEHRVEMDQDPVPMCKEFVRSVVVLFLALYCVY